MIGENKVRSWRRDPIGAGLRVMSARHKSSTDIPMNFDLANMEPDEYEDRLRAEGASENMIAKEVAMFKELKAEQLQPEIELKKKLEQRRQRAVDSSLDAYVQAEIRRIGGVVADELIQDLENE